MHRSGKVQKKPIYLNDFMHLSITAEDVEMSIAVHDDKMHALGAIMMQMSLKEVLKQFGKSAEQGALNEMKQLHDMNEFFPHDPKIPQQREISKALSSLIFLKEKRSGEIKG